MDQPERLPKPGRRDFLKKAGSVFVGGLAATVPMAAGFTVFVDPLRRQGQNGDFVRVASIESLPADGVPRRFSIVADRSDAWNKSMQVPVGAVYLRRSADQKIEALNVVCPHLGCFVDYLAGEKGFSCPCHNSKFGLDGRLADPKSPSPRPLDTLEVELRNGTEIWVKFRNFLAGHAEKIPVS
ncbi:MAG: Rieske 2Fe-2S domain-containing protein [Verrucomicrobia bacterium]|nr:Rieske 2Fe-2S domain-containing protein [Verrucomicrobiota bacterium]